MAFNGCMEVEETGRDVKSGLLNVPADSATDVRGDLAGVGDVGKPPL